MRTEQPNATELSAFLCRCWGNPWPTTYSVRSPTGKPGADAVLSRDSLGCPSLPPREGRFWGEPVVAQHSYCIFVSHWCGRLVPRAQLWTLDCRTWTLDWSGLARVARGKCRWSTRPTSPSPGPSASVLTTAWTEPCRWGPEAMPSRSGLCIQNSLQPLTQALTHPSSHPWTRRSIYRYTHQSLYLSIPRNLQKCPYPDIDSLVLPSVHPHPGFCIEFPPPRPLKHPPNLSVRSSVGSSTSHQFIHSPFYPPTRSIRPSVHPSIYPSIPPFTYRSTHPSVHSSIPPFTYRSTHPSVHSSIPPFTYRSTHPSAHSPIPPFTYRSTHPPVHSSYPLFTHLPTHPSVGPWSVHPFTYPSILPPIYPSIHPFLHSPFYPPIRPPDTSILTSFTVLPLHRPRHQSSYFRRAAGSWLPGAAVSSPWHSRRQRPGECARYSSVTSPTGKAGIATGSTCWAKSSMQVRALQCPNVGATSEN